MRNLPRRTRRCRWCHRALGVLDGWLLMCVGCDFADSGGPPRHDQVKDQCPEQ